MKSLNIIQTLAKIGKIVSQIIYILCCVSFWAGIVALVCYAFLGDNSFKIGGTTVMGLIQSKSGVSAATVCANVVSAVIISAAEAFVARRSLKYFEGELKDGTPFTYDGSKELLKLGIFTIFLPICAVIICSIVIAIVGHFYPDFVKPDWFDNATSSGAGVAMILISLLCRYGAELAEAGKIEAAPANQDEEGKTV